MAEPKASFTMADIKLQQAIREIVRDEIKPLWDSLQRIEEKLGIERSS